MPNTKENNKQFFWGVGGLYPADDDVVASKPHVGSGRPQTSHQHIWVNNGCRSGQDWA